MNVCIIPLLLLQSCQTLPEAIALVIAGLAIEMYV